MDAVIVISAALVFIVALIMFSGVPELWIVSRIIRSITKEQKPVPETIKEKVTMQKIDEMSGSDFEKLCAYLLRKNDFTQIEFIGGSGDQGVDIVAYKDGKKYAVQCKRYNKKVNNKPVQEVFAGKSCHNCDEAIVITNNHFTPGAIEAATATGVLLWDRDKLEEMIANTDP